MDMLHHLLTRMQRVISCDVGCHWINRVIEALPGTAGASSSDDDDDARRCPCLPHSSRCLNIEALTLGEDE